MQTTNVAAILVSAVVFAVGGYIVGTKVDGVKPANRAHGHEGKSCRGSDCDVTITFVCDDPTHPTTSTCDPYADNEVIIMDTGHKMKFTIDKKFDKDFSFDQTAGIKFTSSNSSTYLPCQPQGSSGKMYSCDNNIPAGTPPGVYKYQIYITGFSIVDPFMVNY